MANENLQKFFLFVTFQFGLLVTLILQCYGLVIVHKLLQARRNLLLCAYLASKKRKWHRTQKQRKLYQLRRKPRSCWVSNGRTDEWWRKTLNEHVSDNVWKKNFRMSKDCFYNLVAELDPVIGPRLNTPNYRFLTTEKKLAVALYYLKDKGSLWMTANTFGIHQCTVTKVITEVCSAINQVLGPKYLYLPKTVDEMRAKASEFELKFGMVQAFGCIDGAHIALKRPPDNSQDFYNYKQFFSLNVQAVCDSKGYFMDVECKWPGSVHDANVFANSSIFENLNSGNLPITYLNLLPGYSEIPNYLIGDPAYPLSKFCLKEYQVCNTNGEVVFNNMLQTARNQIECAFGRLKARWGFLSRKVDLKFESVPTVVYSCFVLHNFCERNKDHGLDSEALDVQVQHHIEDETLNIPDPVYSYNNQEGEIVRSVLTEYVTHNLPDHLY